MKQSRLSETTHASTQIPPLRVSVIEAARIIGVSRTRLYRYIKSGAIRAVKDGGRTLLTMKELRAFVERSESVSSGNGCTES